MLEDSFIDVLTSSWGARDSRPFMVCLSGREDMRVSHIDVFQSVALLQHGLKRIRGGRLGLVLIALPPSPDLLHVLLGAMSQSVWTCLTHYPRPWAQLQSTASGLSRLSRQLGADLIITTPDIRGAWNEAGNRKVALATVDEIRAKGGPIATGLPEPVPGVGGVIQLTSGSTGEPKGVRLPWNSVFNCVMAMRESLQSGAGDVVVNWAPLYHDFGLFFGTMLPLLTGLPLVMISPRQWAFRPALLLEAVSRYGGTLIPMTTSAAAHMIRILEGKCLEGVKLNSLRRIIWGAEPLVPDVLQRFHSAFHDLGMRYEAHANGYGMSENVGPITITSLEKSVGVEWIDGQVFFQDQRAQPCPAERPGAFPVCSCGIGVGSEFRVVDGRERLLPERMVGDIQFRSAFMCDGYHRLPKLSDDLRCGGWYRSGDIGYVADGELFVCGRKKDLIIRRGVKISPERLENALAGVDGVRADKVVVFGVEDGLQGTQRLIVACETGRLALHEQSDLEKRIRGRLMEQLQMAPDEIHLVSKGWVEKTTSSKLRRQACRAKYVSELNRSGQ